MKISNVNNLSDARYCAGMYVNLLGFSLEEQDEYYVPPTQFKEITDWLSGLQYVAEFKTSHPDNILNTLKQYAHFDLIQIEEFAHLQMLYHTNYPLIYKAEIDSDKDLDTLINLSPTFREHNILLNLETNMGYGLSPSHIGLLKDLASRCEVLLGFGFDENNVEKVISETRVKGISMRGGHEIKPGIKDFDELADILEVLEVED
ncbi:MAG: phosphoribosylanthranilate isomerase [Cyclobacteriaceae bacterium]